MQETCEAVISAHELFLEDSEAAVNQTLALQLMFDLRFVQTLLLLRESKVSTFHSDYFYPQFILSTKIIS